MKNLMRWSALLATGLLLACGGELGAENADADQALAGKVTSLPGRLQLEDYAQGGEGVAYHDTTAGNSGGAYRQDGVDLQATSDVGGGYNVGWVAAGEWLKYNVTVASSASYDFTLRMAANTADAYTAHVLVDGVGVGARFTLQGGNGWQSWKSVAVKGIPLSAGTHTLRLVFDSDALNVNYLDVARSSGTGGGSDGGTPPPPSSKTIFGINPLGPGASVATDYGTIPIARVYNGTAPLSAACFQSGGLCYRGAMVGQAGMKSGKRLNMSIIFNPKDVTSSTSALAKEMHDFAAAVPDGWYVQMVLFHEYNLHTSDNGGDGSSGGSSADFLRAFPILANAIISGDAGRGRAIPVINPAWDGGTLVRSQIPAASVMPKGSQLHMDIYDNPHGVPSGYHNYGTTYDNGASMPAMYTAISEAGYLAAGYGWGLDELNAPRRVAPRLSALNTTYGWGPLSPYDVDGSGQAASITAMVNFAIHAAVPATTVILFIGTGNWNQTFSTAGTADQDAPAGTSLHQGWPMAVDPSKPFNAYKAFIDASP